MIVPWALLAYFIGAIPTGLLLGRWFGGVDLRTVGSKNIGFTNAWRVLGWRVAVPILLLDAGKAFLATWGLPRLAGNGDLVPVWMGLGVLLGNMFNVFLGFRGGKGIAHALGVFLALAPGATGCAFLTFAILVGAFRFISLGALGAATVLPLSQWGLHGNGAVFWLCLGVAVTVFVKHRANIGRLLAGNESRFGRSGGGPN